MDNLHPLQFGKLVFKRVDGIVTIQLADSARIKIAFSSDKQFS
jgi:hypothetical protein